MMGLMGTGDLYQSDVWLTEVFGYPVYSLNLNHLAQELPGNAPVGRTFQYAKVDASEISTIQRLEKLGFGLIDTNVVFEKSKISKAPLSSAIELRWATPSDEKAIVALAERSFQKSRFHFDPKVDLKTAQSVNREWVRNYFLGKRGESMVIAANEGKPVGFIQILERDQVMIIDMIAVDDQFQGKGIAQSMIAFAEERYKNFKLFRVGTQIANMSAVRLYEKMGYRLSQSMYVFHKHTV